MRGRWHVCYGSLLSIIIIIIMIDYTKIIKSRQVQLSAETIHTSFTIDK